MLTCPVCEEPARRIGARTKRPVIRCTGCGHSFVHAAADELERLYGSAYEGFRPDATFERNVRNIYKEDVLPRLGGPPHGKRALDVGCGNGTILGIARDLHLDVVGVDVSAHSVEHCRSLGFNARQVPFGDFDFGVAQYDLVSFWDVVEHLQDPRPLIRGAARALRPGGLVLVKVPFHHWSSVRLAATFPPLSAPLLQTPAHLQFFSRDSLRRLMGSDFEDFWLQPTGALREPNRGGSLKRRAKRMVVRGLHHLLGDSSALVIARLRRQGAS